MARFDWAHDPNAAEDAKSIGVDPSELLAVLDANEAAIEDARVVSTATPPPATTTGSSNGQCSTS
jgi:hypothetical protein